VGISNCHRWVIIVVVAQYGDPICIDEESKGRIVYFNHDNDFELIFINSSVSQLAESLLAYRHLVTKTNETNGKGAFLDRNIPKELQLWIFEELSSIDGVALEEGCFWKESLDELQK